MRVLIITDSLGMPRERPERIYDFQCWPLKLATEFECSIFSIRGLTTNDILNQYFSTLKMYTPDVVIVQVGIVDCAPRVLSRKIEKIISLLPGLRSAYRFLMKRYRRVFNKLYNLKYVSLDEFKKNIRKINDMFNGKPVFFIPIFPASDEYENVLPRIKANIQLYNNIIAKYKTIDYKCNNPVFFTMSDFHHLNTAGHNLIYEEVLKTINSIR